MRIEILHDYGVPFVNNANANAKLIATSVMHHIALML